MQQHNGRKLKEAWMIERIEKSMQIETMEENCQSLIKFYFDIIVLGIEKMLLS